MQDSLVIHWFYLLPAVAMLWLPRQWLRRGVSLFKRRRLPTSAAEKLAKQGSREPDDKSVHLRKEFTTFRNYVDFFRALAGGHGLSTYAFTATGEGPEQTVLIVQSVILVIAVAIQALRFGGHRPSFFPPIFWFVGLSIGFPAHYAGLFAFALVLAVNPAIPDPRWFLTVLGLLVLAVGYPFGAPAVANGIAAGLILLVPLASLLAKRPVVVFSRKGRSRSSA